VSVGVFVGTGVGVSELTIASASTASAVAVKNWTMRVASTAKVAATSTIGVSVGAASSSACASAVAVPLEKNSPLCVGTSAGGTTVSVAAGAIVGLAISGERVGITAVRTGSSGVARSVAVDVTAAPSPPPVASCAILASGTSVGGGSGGMLDRVKMMPNVSAKASTATTTIATVISLPKSRRIP
jgi:hypothetical protein